MANNVVIKDNSAAVKAQFNKNIGKCLNILGMEFVRLSGEEADRLIYNTPLPNRWARRKGDYRRNLVYQVNIGDKVVYCGVDQSIFYAFFGGASNLHLVFSKSLTSAASWIVKCNFDALSFFLGKWNCENGQTPCN